MPTVRKSVHRRGGATPRSAIEANVGCNMKPSSPFTSPPRRRPVSATLRVGYENEDYFDYRWWPVAEITESVERFYPSRLPELVLAHLDGQHIDEPYEVWS